MARPLRIEYKNAIYHVLNRGRRREEIFWNDADYYMFLNTLQEAVDQFGIVIHSYSLMPNHYHLLIQTPKGNLSRAMRHINGVYTQKFNAMHNLEGTLFKGRYKAILIEEEEYLLQLVRYIHQNPYKANLEKHLGEHMWTSHKAYLEPNFRLPLLTTDIVLNHFANREKLAIEKFHEFCCDEIPASLVNRLDSVNWPSVMGSDKFKAKVEEMLFGKDLSEVSKKEIISNIKIINLKEVFDIINNRSDIIFNGLNLTLKQKDKLIQALCIRICFQEGAMTLTKIAEFFDTSRSTISRLYKESLDKKYDELYDRAKEVLKNARKST